MRILLLTLLIAGPYFYFREDTVHYEPTAPKEDAVKLKLMAPARSQAVQPTVPVAIEQESTSSTNSEETDSEETEHTERNPAVSDLEHAEEVQWTDLEESWNQELKAMLNRLEPDDGDEIHKSYVQEQEAFQAEMDALLNEKNQKTTEEATAEIDQLISQLDQKHQEKLKEILGAHYEAVRDHYDQYMEASVNNQY